MRTHKGYLVLVSMAFLLSGVLVFGVSRPSRSAVTYSTEDIAESPSGTVTTETRDHKVYRTKAVPRTPHRPEAPNAPKVPKAPKAADCGGDYPTVDGGRMHLRPYGPYLAGRRLHPDGEWGAFWPGLLGIDLSYSWSGNSGYGEFGYWPYGYRYAWGDGPDDASGCDWEPMAIESDPNTIRPADTTYSTEDIRPVSDRPLQPSDSKETPAVPASDTAADGHTKQDG